MPLLGPNGQPLNEAPPAEAEPVAEEPQGPVPCVTAFVVYQLPDGNWQVSDDLNVPLMPQRKAMGDDFTSGSANVLRDVQTQELIHTMAQTIGPSIVNSTLQNIPQAMAMFGQQMRQGMEAQQVAADLERQRQAGRR